MSNRYIKEFEKHGITQIIWHSVDSEEAKEALAYFNKHPRPFKDKTEKGTLYFCQRDSKYRHYFTSGRVQSLVLFGDLSVRPLSPYENRERISDYTTFMQFVKDFNVYSEKEKLGYGYVRYWYKERNPTKALNTDKVIEKPSLKEERDCWERLDDAFDAIDEIFLELHALFLNLEGKETVTKRKRIKPKATKQQSKLDDRKVGQSRGSIDGA